MAHTLQSVRDKVLYGRVARPPFSIFPKGSGLVHRSMPHRLFLLVSSHSLKPFSGGIHHSLPVIQSGADFLACYLQPNLMPSPHVPPSKKRLVNEFELLRLIPKKQMTNEIAIFVIIT